MVADTAFEAQWSPVGFETLPWHVDPESLEGVPKSRRRKITSTYEAAVPFSLRGKKLAIPSQLQKRIEEVSMLLVRFDARQEARGYDLPAMLLRSESAASSQIENMTSSVRNVALAELAGDVPHNAQVIAGNVAAMRKALEVSGDLSVQGIQGIHAALIGRNGAEDGQSFGGCLRDEQVWVGGTAYSPHGALFVPPCASRIPECLDDLVSFVAESDMGSVAKAAVAHAQFETIHPFIDGNGRTGRTLLHVILRNEDVLRHASLPISAGLLHNIDAYMDAIAQFQAGNPLAIVEQLVEALELALVVGNSVARDIDEVFDEWDDRLHERKGSSMLRLPNLLAKQPVVDVPYVARELGVTERAASSVIAKACDYGMLRPMGNRRRGVFYQADVILSVLEEVSSMQGIRRLVSGQ